MTIPIPLDTDYCDATSHDIRSWSFGALTSPRHASATFRDNVAGTLHDQRIFGPIHDFKCACGRYDGDRFKNMICDRCGVKVASSTIRGSRFGHIEFASPIAHPFAPDKELQCFPVLPILFIESPGGHRLQTLYDQLIDDAKEKTATRIAETINSICDQIAPVAIAAHDWDLSAAGTLARGLALKHKDSPGTSREYCNKCGYLLAGLQVDLCPGCGSQLQCPGKERPNNQ
ncbi:MAG: hypothetical protein R3C53_28680 [Pirellulaceae bacterium]